MEYQSDIVKELKNAEISNYTFRPKGPSQQFEWLNTKHINDVIDQYHKLYPDFLYLGAVPSDFEEVHQLGLSNLNFNDFEKENKFKIGMVINLDESTQSGSHWVGLFFNLNNYQIYYYDSVGKQPIRKIKKFINRIYKYLYFKKFNYKLPLKNVVNILNSLKKNKIINYDIDNVHIQNILSNSIDIRHNHIQHQFKNTECGVYSIYFIIRMIRNELFDNVINNPINDKNINKFRENFFHNVILKKN